MADLASSSDSDESDDDSDVDDAEYCANTEDDSSSGRSEVDGWSIFCFFIVDLIIKLLRILLHANIKLVV